MKHDIMDIQESSSFQHVVNIYQCNLFSEIGQVVKCSLYNHQVDRIADMPVT